MSTPDPTAARALAETALAGRTDKTGRPLAEHAARIAQHTETPEARAIAYLHDIVEDSATSLDALEAQFGPAVREAIDTVTRRADETYRAYIERVARGPRAARQVKILDLEDHLARREHIPDSLVRRYEDALAALHTAEREQAAAALAGTRADVETCPDPS